MKMNNKEKNLLIVSVMTMTLLMFVTPAHADLNTTELQNWLHGYLTPLYNTLTWAIPVILGIYLLIKAISWWQAEAEGAQEKPYWVTVKKGIIVGVVAESVTLLLSIFSIS